jgi:hypothetical protein
LRIAAVWDGGPIDGNLHACNRVRLRFIIRGKNSGFLFNAYRVNGNSEDLLGTYDFSVGMFDGGIQDRGHIFQSDAVDVVSRVLHVDCDTSVCVKTSMKNTWTMEIIQVQKQKVPSILSLGFSAVGFPRLRENLASAESGERRKNTSLGTFTPGAVLFASNRSSPCT